MQYQNLSQVNCIMFVDRSTFREDYARIYDRVNESLIAKGVSVLTVIAPGATDQERIRFKSYHPVSVEELKKNRQYLTIKHLIGFITQMMKGKIPLSRRRPWTWSKFYTMFSVIMDFFEQYQPNLVVSMKYDSCYPFVVAANSLSIPTLAIQHGDYYCDTDFDYGNDCLRQVSHEWAASVLLVWNHSVMQFCKSKFGNSHNYRSIDGPLWHVRYSSRTAVRTDLVIIYESDSSLWSTSLINSVINYFGIDKVRIKPHPYLLSKNLSDAALQFPGLLVSQPLWEVVPKLGISFSSTVTDELIFNDCVCVTITHQKKIGVNFPFTGTFSIDAIGNILVFLEEVYISQSKYQQVLAAQKGERGEFVSTPLPVADRIAEICQEYIKSNTQTFR
ncbi:MAG: hypothetical protein ACL9RN_00010 [Cylindrospermopsis raciborskii]|uniref:hypothetical protein n=1 Tax=Cylindrospermopsis raciborskii TaxID=77022 RepID=UPI003D139D1F